MTDSSKIILQPGYDDYHKREEFSEHLGFACIKALKEDLSRIVVIDYTAERKAITADKLLAISLILAQKWRRNISDKRVGIVITPGIGGMITNLALVLADKSPVNLNFTTGRSSQIASINKAGLTTIISAEKLISKFDKFPWPEKTIDISAEIKGINKIEIISWLLLIKFLSADAIAKKIKLRKTGNDTEAAILFSSGSTGTPKGVVLTHRNILGNSRQISDVSLMFKNEKLLASLPLFHSFGFTVTIWHILLKNLIAVTLPSPLEVKKISEVIKKEQVSILLGTPTFFRPYFKKVNPVDLKSLRIVVAGAEKTPDGFNKLWEEKFGSQYLEGYGITETAPVVSVNLPEKENKREKSVGKMMPGMIAKIINPDNEQEISIHEIGILALRGINVFPGYLDDVELNQTIFQDGWYVTGDLARFDRDGYLYIEGRLSRFSKIGGEMVPHGAIEDHIIAIFKLEQSEKQIIAVTGIKDEVKGESLVLLTTVVIEANDLRQKLKDVGLSNLWIPKIVRKVEVIPCLASGKLDIRGLQKMASELG